MENRLKNKVAIITGGNSGIGKAIALLFSKERAKVVIAGLDLTKGNQVTKQRKNIIFIKTDVTKYPEVEKLIKKTIDKYGKIDILVNNAGGFPQRPEEFLEISDESWNKTIDLNLKGVFNCIKAVVPYMKKQRSGKIINISSISGIVGSLSNIAYGASKAGVINITKTLKKELAKYNITINCIAPGPVKTNLIKKIDKEMIKEITKKTPLGRIAEPEDIAKPVLFFASSDSNHITGQTLVVDGGKIT